MRTNSYLATSSLFLAVSLLTGCASTPSEANIEHRQRQALANWNNCIERYLPKQGGGVMDSQLNLEQACDGHKRDVLMTYPERMEKKLDAYLVQKTRERAIKNMAYQSAGMNASDENEALLRAAIQ